MGRIPFCQSDRSFACDRHRHRDQVSCSCPRLQRLVGSVANNINQIARHANSTGDVPPNAAAAIADAKSVIIRIDRHLEHHLGERMAGLNRCPMTPPSSSSAGIGQGARL